LFFIAYVTPCKGYECPISKLCIPKTWICDGTVDCGDEDNSDESGDCSKFKIKKKQIFHDDYPKYSI
jgi:hypothetical protein